MVPSLCKSAKKTEAVGCKFVHMPCSFLASPWLTALGYVDALPSYPVLTSSSSSSFCDWISLKVRVRFCGRAWNSLSWLKFPIMGIRFFMKPGPSKLCWETHTRVQQRLITGALNFERVSHMRCYRLVKDSWKSGRMLSKVPALFPWLTAPFCMLWLCLRVLGAGQIPLPDNGGTFGACIFCLSQWRLWLALTDVSRACGHSCDWQQSPDCGACLSQPSSPSPECRVACNTFNTAANNSNGANNERILS